MPTCVQGDAACVMRQSALALDRQTLKNNAVAKSAHLPGEGCLTGSLSNRPFCLMRRFVLKQDESSL